LTSLPALPTSLWRIFCYDNRLTRLPTLPASLTELDCRRNQLTGLDVTGLSLRKLDCSYNNMTSKSAVTGFTGTWGSWSDSFVYDPQNNEPFWSTWPPFLVSILRYVFFGWLWMRWM